MMIWEKIPRKTIAHIIALCLRKKKRIFPVAAPISQILSKSTPYKGKGTKFLLQTYVKVFGVML